MKRLDYQLLENYMLQCMSDSAHDREHVYRVLYVALDIAEHEAGVDKDVLIAACLLHDIARKEQLENPRICHAAAGADKAYDFLTANGFSAEFAGKVAACIRKHRFRSDDQPETIEEKILFDADKIDVTGTLGIARTLLYKGKTGEPLYSLDRDGLVSDGDGDETPSFFQEYKYKLEKLYSRFYTNRGGAIALERQKAAVSFYDSMRREAQESYAAGKEILARQLGPGQ